MSCARCAGAAAAHLLPAAEAGGGNAHRQAYVSDHAMSAGEELAALNAAFDELRQKADIPTPNWDALEIYMERIRFM